ncbi:MAG: hypothetical protein Marn2KO_36250 [Marinobacter nauticus]
MKGRSLKSLLDWGLAQFSGHNLKAQALRFVSAGAINTLATIALYQLLLFIMPPLQAYTLSWATGFVAMLVLYPKYVFPSDRLTVRMVFTIAAIYGFSLILGNLVLYCLETLGLTARLGVFLSVLVSSVFNFYALRLVLAPPSSSTSSGQHHDPD